MIRIACLLAAALLAAPSIAQIPTKIYAQELVDRMVARNPDLLVVVMHVTPPKGKDNVIIASNIGRLGKVADADDIRVMAHGGHRHAVELALHDVVGETIGALGLVWPYKPGQDKAPLGKKAEKIREALAKRILNAGNLMDPFPFEASATTKTRAQKLVDEAQAKQPEILVLAMRAPPRGTKDIVVLGSTFGRHGKKADADDLKILTATEPATGVYSNGKRFGVDLPLRDASGKTIGTMNVGYRYKEGDDPKALVRKAERLSDDLRERIASSDQLGELDP